MFALSESFFFIQKEDKMNKVNLTGRITATPELKKSSNNYSYMRVNVAVKKERDKDKVFYIPVTFFGKVAEYISTYAVKGDLIEVSGSLETSQHKDEAGNISYYWGVSAENASILAHSAKTGGTKPSSFAEEEEIALDGFSSELPN